MVEKPFATLLAWVGWTYSHSQQRHVFGFHIVLLFWCTGLLRIPVGFRLWRPKRKGVAPYRTKLALAQDVVFGVLRTGLAFEYLTFDLWYNARWFVKWLDQHTIIWVSTLKSNALITYRGRTQPVAVWAQQLPRHRIAGHTWAWVGTCISRNTAPSDSSSPQTAWELWTTSSATICLGGGRCSSTGSAVAGISKRVSATPSSW